MVKVKRTPKTLVDESLRKYEGKWKCVNDALVRTIRLDKDTLLMKRKKEEEEFKIEVKYLEHLIRFKSFIKI